MARDHARINLAIWNDDDFLDLPPLAQHLYFVLWTHPELSYAGVVDWHPARLAARSAGWTAEDVILAGKCLEARLFVVIDEVTEECLIRSWARWDGLMKQPIVAVSFAKARAAVASRDIRAVIVHEALKHQKREPNLPGWAKPQVQELLSNRSLDPRDRHLPTDPLTPAATPGVTPGPTPAVRVNPGVGANPSANPSPTPTPSPTPSPKEAPRKRGTRLPDDFAITDDMRSWAAKNAGDVDLDAATEEFADYWRAVAGPKGVKLDWVATWRNDMRRKQDRSVTARPQDRPRPGASVWDRPVTREDRQ